MFTKNVSDYCKSNAHPTSVRFWLELFATYFSRDEWRAISHRVMLRRVMSSAHSKISPFVYFWYPVSRRLFIIASLSRRQRRAAPACQPPGSWSPIASAASSASYRYQPELMPTRKSVVDLVLKTEYQATSATVLIIAETSAKNPDVRFARKNFEIECQFKQDSEEKKTPRHFLIAEMTDNDVMCRCRI